MKKLIKTELYLGLHNDILWIIIVLIIASSLFGLSCDATGDVSTVMVFKLPVKEEQPQEYQEYIDALQSIVPYRWPATWQEQKDGTKIIVIDVNAKYLFEPGGNLYNQYGWLLQKDYQTMQYYHYECYPIDQKHLEESQRFKVIITYFSLTALIGSLLSVYYFGHGFKRRLFSEEILSGYSRRQVFRAKFICYIVISIIISMITILIPILLFVPNIKVLGIGCIMDGILFRLFFDFLVLMIPVIVVCLIKNYALSIILLYFANYVFLNLAFLRNESPFITEIKELLPVIKKPDMYYIYAAILLISIFSYEISYLLFKKSNLK